MGFCKLSSPVDQSLSQRSSITSDTLCHSVLTARLNHADPAEELTPPSNMEAVAIHKHEQILTKTLILISSLSSLINPVYSMSQAAPLQPTQSQSTFQLGPQAGLLLEPRLLAPEMYEGNPETC